LSGRPGRGPALSVPRGHRDDAANPQAQLLRCVLWSIKIDSFLPPPPS
jgi:hypothetical protein